MFSPFLLEKMMSDNLQQEIQQLDKRINRVEIVLVNFTEDLKSLNDALKSTTEHITKFAETQQQSHQETYNNIKAEIANTKNEIGRPNWSFWAIAVSVILAIITGSFWFIQSEMSHNKEVAEIKIQYHEKMQEKEFASLKEIIDLKVSNGKK